MIFLYKTGIFSIRVVHAASLFNEKAKIYKRQKKLETKLTSHVQKDSTLHLVSLCFIGRI